MLTGYDLRQVEGIAAAALVDRVEKAKVLAQSRAVRVAAESKNSCSYVSLRLGAVPSREFIVYHKWLFQNQGTYVPCHLLK